MNIQEQIKEKENMISELLNEIEQLTKYNIIELTKDYQKCIGKYYKIDTDWYVKIKSINGEDYCYCISIRYDSAYNSIVVDDDEIEQLCILDKAKETTKQEILDFVSMKAKEII